MSLEEKELSYEEAKNDFFNNYAGSLKISDNAEEEYNQHRLNKFDIMDYAGVIKSDIPDDIKIKDIKLNDKQYLEERFGITGEENEKK